MIYRHSSNSRRHKSPESEAEERQPSAKFWGEVQYSTRSSFVPSATCVDRADQEAALDYAGNNFRSKNVLPGVVRTPFVMASGPEDMINQLKQNISMGRLGAAEEIANALLDWPSYTSGGAIFVEGAFLSRK